MALNAPKPGSVGSKASAFAKATTAKPATCPRDLCLKVLPKWAKYCRRCGMPIPPPAAGPPPLPPRKRVAAPPPLPGAMKNPKAPVPPVKIASPPYRPVQPRPKAPAAATSPNPALAKPRQPDFTNPLGMSFVRIEPGSFLMGSPDREESRGADERQHSVTLTTPFMIQTTLVTQSQWLRVMAANPSQKRGDHLPVESVTWDEAVEFCRLLSEKQGKAYRLPTEAEWEYACRAGTITRFATGETVEDLTAAGWYSRDGGDATHLVARKYPNAWGLYDMHGCLWQWCSDFYGPYTADAQNPSGPAQGDGRSSRVLRGGSWYLNPNLCRVAFRHKHKGSVRHDDIGFRVCAEV